MIIERHNRLKAHERFLDETIFTTQNRYLGVRACYEESVDDQDKTIRGTYINGIYDTHKIKYEEKAYGFPDYGEGIVNLPDAQTIYIKVGQTILSPKTCKIINLKRYFHLDKGYTQRQITYQTPEGHHFTLNYKRLTSLTHKELFMIDASVTSIDYTGPLTIISTLNGDVKNDYDLSDPRLASSDIEKLDIIAIEAHQNYGWIKSETKHTHFEIMTLMTHDQSFTYHQDFNQVIAEKTIHINQNEPASFRKYALYFNQLDHENPYNETMILYKSLENIDIYQEQLEEIKAFWDFANIEIEDKDNPELNTVIHYNLYQLYTSGGGNNRTNIPAKGLTGEGYEGHTFWDTEIYMIPFFMQIDPLIAKTLLNNRFGQIDAARYEARQVGVNQGIKFPWRTISGKETSPYFLAGQAQYHINSDIAYSFIKNYQLHKDDNYFINYGLPVLIETSRFFLEILVYENEHYHLHNVTGPDEYTTMVNDNFYTNSMVQYQFKFLTEFIKNHPKKTKNILETYKVSSDELKQYHAIAHKIYLPFNEDLGIDAQDDDFLSKERWDFSQTKDEDYPLLLHFHPLKIYRHQVLKQPDTVLSHYLLANRPVEIMKKTYAYYEPLTTHDSSLSRCIHAVQAARLGQVDKAYRYFLDTVYLDLNNVQKNTEYGLHVANLGGIYLTLLNGFLGLTIDENISIYPSLPKHIEHLKLNFRINEDTIIKAHLTHKEIKLQVNKPTTIYIYDEQVKIKEQITRKIR